MRPNRWTGLLLAAAAALTFVAAIAQTVAVAPERTAPGESVRVRLVLVEVLVTDRAGRTIPDLAKDDFTLLVDYRPVDVDVVDVNCAAGALDDPDVGRVESPPVGSDGRDPRRVVLVLDWMHAGFAERPESLAAARDLIRQRRAPGEEVMIAIVADGLQIVQPFTDDAAALVAALDRVEANPRSWAQPPPAGVTSRPFFQALGRLMDVLQQYGGPKAAVLVSSWNGRADEDDAWFLDVAHRAADSRTAIYPVFSPGLTDSPLEEPFAGSRSLARLANESGGRYTRATNERSLAFARAQRDLSCRYAVGFYLAASDDDDVSRTVTVRVARPGATVRHPERLRGWSAAERRRSATFAAFHDPARSLDPSIRIGARRLRPGSSRAWDVLLAVRHDPPAPRAPDTPAARIGLLVSAVGRLRHAIDRTVRTVDENPDAVASWERTVRLEPGSWDVTVVLDDPESAGPRTGIARVDVPEVPRGLPFVTGMTLGVTGVGSVGDRGGEAFDPIVDDVAPRGAALAVSSSVCLVDVFPERTRFTVRRVLTDAGGREIGAFDPVAVDLDGFRAVRCRGLIDRLPSEDLEPGDYRFEARVGEEAGGAAVVRFRVEPRAVDGTAPDSAVAGVRRGTARRPN